MQYWYLFINNSQVGPLSLEEVRKSLITPETMVWHEGMPGWLPASQVPELASLFTPGASGGYGAATPPPPHGTENGYTQSNVNGSYQQGYSTQNQQQGYYSPGGNQAPYGAPGNNYYVSNSGKDKTAAGILAILLGGLGVQYFYLGKIAGGFITILLSLVTCGLWPILTLVQGILMLTMSEQEFDEKYVYTDSVFPLF